MRRTNAPGSDNGFYVDEDRNSGRQGTAITAEDRNAIQDELIHVIENAGLIPSGADNTQLESAIGRMIADQVEISTSQAIDLGAYRSSLLVSVANGTPLTLTLNGPIGRPGRYLFVVNEGTDTVTIDGTAGIMATLSPGSVLFAVGDGTAMSMHSLTSSYARGLMAAANAAEARGVLDVYSDAEVDSALESRDSSISAVLLSLVTNQWDDGTKLVAFDAEPGDIFGRSVAIGGSYAVVGAPQEDAGGSNSGAAYVFRRLDVNTWDTGVKLAAPDIFPNALFGWSVAIDGDYIAIGAQTGNAAYIFHRIGANTWDAGVKLVASDREPGDSFGRSIAIDGDYVVVGAHNEDAGGSSAGAAYVFRRTDVNTWDAGVKLVAPDAQADARFGEDVEIHEDYVIVGAHQESAGGVNAGAAYVFRRTDVNTWDAGVKLVAPDAQAQAYFGEGVAIQGNYAVVGAPNALSGDPPAGTAYVFRRTGVNEWDAGTKLVTPEGGQVGDRFGHDVAIDGDCLIIGAWGESVGYEGAGTAYVFRRSSSNAWRTGVKLLAPEASQSASFGWGVAVNGDYVIVGARNESSTIPSGGAAYVFSESFRTRVRML